MAIVKNLHDLIISSTIINCSSYKQHTKILLYHFEAILIIITCQSYVRLQVNKNDQNTVLPLKDSIYKESLNGVSP